MDVQTIYDNEIHGQVDYLNDNFETIEAEPESLNKEQILRIEIDEELENAIKDLENLQSQLPKEQAKFLL